MDQLLALKTELHLVKNALTTIRQTQGRHELQEEARAAAEDFLLMKISEADFIDHLASISYRREKSEAFELARMNLTTRSRDLEETISVMVIKAGRQQGMQPVLEANEKHKEMVLARRQGGA
jgi:hypothetical protein